MTLVFLFSIWFWSSVFINPSRLDILIFSVVTTFIVYDLWEICEWISKKNDHIS